MACIDIDGAASLCENLLGRSTLSERVRLIFGVTAAISMPSNTCNAASTFPFWYSYLPSSALASYKYAKPILKDDEKTLFQPLIK